MNHPQPGAAAVGKRRTMPILSSEYAFLGRFSRGWQMRLCSELFVLVKTCRQTLQAWPLYDAGSFI
jgi:hypothetical protein